MKVNTTIWSFLLSLWKHVVRMSLSSAPAQNGNLCSMQNFLLHDAHVDPEARVDDSPEDGCFERGMMVLLVKHVHLQNEGGEAASTEIMKAQSTSMMVKRVIVSSELVAGQSCDWC